MAEEGKQFAGWTVASNTVTLENAKDPVTSFEMVGKNVTITANYEDITETSNTGDYARLIWIGLAVVLIVIVGTLLIIRKRIIKKC